MISQKKKIDKLVVKERTGELTILNQLINGLRFFTETVLFISVGAVATAWERIGKILNSTHVNQPGGDPEPLVPSHSPSPEKIEVKVKVPLLPIDDYQQLTAEQVIQRMKGLSPDQLETIRYFESNHEKRKPVLEMINQVLNREES